MPLVVKLRRGGDRAHHRRGQGWRRRADRKLEVARRIHDIVDEGVRPAARAADLRRSHLHARDRRRRVPRSRGSRRSRASGRIKAGLPGVLTSLGVSNVSFGLGKEARAVLNSVFLYHCVQAGLDMAIVNPADITPYRGDRRRGPSSRRGPGLRPRSAGAVHSTSRTSRAAPRTLAPGRRRPRRRR